MQQAELELASVASLVECLVLYPACMHLPARNSLVNEVEFLGFIPKSGNDQ